MLLHPPEEQGRPGGLVQHRRGQGLIASAAQEVGTKIVMIFMTFKIFNRAAVPRASRDLSQTHAPSGPKSGVWARPRQYSGVDGGAAVKARSSAESL